MASMNSKISLILYKELANVSGDVFDDTYLYSLATLITSLEKWGICFRGLSRSHMA